MRLIYPRQIKKQASAALSAYQPDYRKLVFVHAAISSALMLVLSLTSLLLDYMIAQTQGLDGIGTAAALKSLNAILLLAANMLLPFWQMGILYTSVRIVRRQNAEFSMLAQGFRRIMPFAGYYAMLMLLFFGVAMLCMNCLILPMLCVPVPAQLQAAMETLDYTDIAQIEAFQVEHYGEMMEYTMPFFVVFMVVYCSIVAVLMYRFRMCSYLLLEDQKIGVLQAFRTSSKMTKGERKNLFLLDLSFWWYYLITTLISVIIYMPDILQAIGVELPVSYETANFIAYLAYMLCYLILTGLAGAYHQTSLACAYEKLWLAHRAKEEPKAEF